ncbi:putative membrane protein [Ralstonia sp. 25mfcol4.1]|uniref:DUF4142 domain-containing protein n=1 Tax=Ralstonia sp. 25mfcol4.1 TaxID=1761899 RepID=UPI00089054C7|nr:DUF4142 domain-containing protein [Ralstonia sp. 25mfcol4.1]SDP24988.1 putative membrane protein [Ralstonia sp. 25mfcol4.1]
MPEHRNPERTPRRWPRHVAAAALALCGLAAASLAPAAPPVADAPLAPTPPKAAKPPAASLSTDDLRFLDEAQMTSHLEISASEMALEVSKDPKIHAFAQQMVAEHKEALGRLRSLAADKGITPQDRVPEAPELTRLKSLKDDEFDQAYIRTIGIDAHEQAVLLFQNQATRGKDPALRAFAARMLPGLRDHLKQARKMDRRVTAGR